MGMMFPMYNGGNNPQYEATQTSAGACDVTGPKTHKGVQGLDLVGVHGGNSRASASVGFLINGETLIGSDVGNGDKVNGLQSADVVGSVSGINRQGAEVRTDINAFANAARIALDVLTSLTTKTSVGRMALSVSNQLGYIALQAMTVLQRASAVGYSILEVANGVARAARSALQVGGIIAGWGRQSTDIVGADDDGLTIVTDVVGSGLTPSGTYQPIVNSAARLLVEGVEYPIREFSYQEPSGKIGALLNVTLARPLPSVVPPNADFVFQIGWSTGNNALQWIDIVANGKIAGRNYSISYGQQGFGGPDDVVSFDALDVMADRFTLAPRKPIIMYDGLKVAPAEVDYRPSQLIMNEQFQPIYPILERVDGLKMHTALLRAYGNRGGTTFVNNTTGSTGTYNTIQPVSSANDVGAGLGFSSVITNIRNYPVKRVDFRLEASWHDAVQPLVAMYDPIYFVEGNTLYIIDVAAPLPVGFTPRTVGVSRYSRLETRSTKQFQNALLVTYQGDPNEYTLFREIFLPTEIEERGTFGQSGYVRQETVRKVRQFYTAEEPDATLAELPLTTEVKTYQNFPNADGSPGPLTLIHRETQQDFYTNLLKTGHNKVIESLIMSGTSGVLLLQDVLSEDCTITWKQDPINSSQWNMSKSTTQIAGLVYPLEDTRTINGEDYTIFVPALVAQAQGFISDATQIQQRAIKTIIEYIRPNAGNQTDVQTIITNHLDGTVERSLSQPRTGQMITSDISARARTVMLRDLSSESEIGARTPASLNTGELPQDLAFALARNVLHRLANPQVGTTFTLPDVDFAIRRGSVIIPQDRSTNQPANIVTGRSIQGRSLGQEGHRITMSFEGVELTTQV